jgi:hypothetical protein
MPTSREKAEPGHAASQRQTTGTMQATDAAQIEFI